MLCPECSKKLTSEGDGIFVCPSGHGSLVSGGYLQDVRQKEVVPEVTAQNTPHDPSREIICPHCDHKMVVVDYDLSGIMIDSCTNCYYRWLDEGELHKVANDEPKKLSPKDLLLLHNLDQEVHGLKNKQAGNPNPRVKGFNLSRIIGPGVIGGSGGSRSRFSAIAGIGLVGIIKGLLHSKWSAYLIIITLIIVAIGYYFFFNSLT